MTKVFVIRSFNLIMSRSRHVQFEVMTSNFPVSPDIEELKGLLPIMMGWSPDGWLIEDVKKKETDQMSLF